MSDTPFVHLHAHSHYSFLDGFSSPGALAERAKELGMPAMAVTDHNHLGATIDFQKACIKQGIKPILGLESYYTEDRKTLALDINDRKALATEAATKAGVDLSGKLKKKEINKRIEPFMYDTKQYHILFLAINQTGWQNLVKLQSEAALDCTFNGRFLCDDELIEKHQEGLIMTTACISNPLSKYLNPESNDYNPAYAEEKILKWKRIFGDRFYLEIQPLNIDIQWGMNRFLLEMHSKHDIPIISTNDVHYARETDHDDHDTLLCIGTGKMKSETERMQYSNDFWIKTLDEMIASYEEQIPHLSDDEAERTRYREAIQKSLEEPYALSQRIESIQIEADEYQLPDIKFHHRMTTESYLQFEAFKALYKYKARKPAIDIRTYEKRLKEELDIINNKGFASYMLVVQDYIKNSGCPTGPGRGSGGGSLLLFLLGITKIIDPIEHKLLFSRFMTPDRTALPDIDTDFCYYNRWKTIKYLEDKYGKDCVSFIGTYSVLGVKSGIKDVSRVLGLPFVEANQISKKIDEILDMPSPKFKDYDELKVSPIENERNAHKEFAKLEEKYPEIFRLARRFEGTPRQNSTHASGILVTPNPVTNNIPVFKNKDGYKVSLFDGEQLEDLKFVKYDILGLKTISVIGEALKNMNYEGTLDDFLESLDLNDPRMFKMVQKAETDGMFQIESDLFKGMCKDIRPDQFNDFTVITSLGRPGPLSIKMDKAYANRKHGFEKAKEPLPDTWEIVEDTLGTLVYQEQIMRIAQKVAKFDDNQADSYLRKATAKKKIELMNLCKQWFVYGKVNEPYPEGYDPENTRQTMYDPEAKYGAPILGGIENAYDEQELYEFFDSLEGFASYLFNKSHAAAYSVLTAATGYLKRHHPVEFMAALLSVRGDSNEQMDRYLRVARKMGIKVEPPDINKSGRFFTPDRKEKKILFGLERVKGLGLEKVNQIIDARPYTGLEDIVDRVPKKYFNKKAGENLIKAGAFRAFELNRHRLLNDFYALRKDRNVEQFNEQGYTEDTIIDFETEVLEAPVTVLPYWENVIENRSLKEQATVTKVEERTDKRGRLMAFGEAKIQNSDVRFLVFAHQYKTIRNQIFPAESQELILKGEKDDKGTFLVQGIESLEKTQRRPKLKFF